MRVGGFSGKWLEERPGTRTAQDEIQPLFLNKAMHLIQKIRQSLHFVHDHPAAG